MHNKGWYVATLTVNYSELIEGKIRKRIRRSSVISNRVATINIPESAFNISVIGTLKTGLIWKPTKLIFKTNICRFSSEFNSPSSDKIIAKFNVWGTTLHSGWAMDKSSYYSSDIDMNKICNNLHI